MTRVRDYWLMACPRCTVDTGLIITVEIEVRPAQDSAEIESGTYGDGVWHDDSPVRCEHCRWQGVLANTKLVLQPVCTAA